MGLMTGHPKLDYAGRGSGQARRPPRSPVLAIALISLMLLPLIIVAVYPVAALLPFGWEAMAIVEVPTQRPGRYGGFAGFHIVARGTGRGDRTRLTSAYVVYSGMDKPGQLDVDLPAMTYRLGLYGHEHTGPRPLTRESVIEYISRAGFSADFPESRATADALLDELRRLAAGSMPPDRAGQPYPLQAPRTSYSMAGEHFVNLGELGHLVWLPWYTPACMPIWVLACIYIGRRMLRRYRQRLAQS